MTLRAACDIALACGLTTTSEALSNVAIHATSVFNYTDIPEELQALRAEYDKVGDKPILDVYPDLAQGGDEPDEP